MSNSIINAFPKKIKKDVKKAIEILKKYGCSEVYLFGSVVNGEFNENSDIDIAVRGLKDEYFFKAFAELEIQLFNVIELIDLDDKQNRFAQFIMKKRELIKLV